jgi:hypothetical protein
VLFFILVCSNYIVHFSFFVSLIFFFFFFSQLLAELQLDIFCFVFLISSFIFFFFFLTYSHEQSWNCRLYVLWGLLLFGLVLNSGAVSQRFKLEISVELPVLISIILWAIVFLTPLLIRLIYRHYCLQERLIHRVRMSQAIEQQLMQQEARLYQYHNIMSRMLKDLQTDIGGVHADMKAAEVPLSSVPHSPSLSPSAKADRTSSWQTRHIANSRVDRLFHRAGVIRGREANVPRAQDWILPFDSDFTDIAGSNSSFNPSTHSCAVSQQMCSMAQESSDRLAQVRAELCDFITTAASLRREFNEILLGAPPAESQSRNRQHRRAHDSLYHFSSSIEDLDALGSDDDSTPGRFSFSRK